MTNILTDLIVVFVWLPRSTTLNQWQLQMAFTDLKHASQDHLIPQKTVVTAGESHKTAPQIQKAVTAYLKSKQLLPFGIARQQWRSHKAR